MGLGGMLAAHLICKMNKKVNKKPLRKSEPDMGQLFEKLIEHDGKFEEHDARFDRVYDKLLEHDTDIAWIKENMATKADLTKVFEALGKLMGITMANSQEITMMCVAVERLTDKVEEHDVAIKELQHVVGIA